MKAIRGATSLEVNSIDEISSKTRELISSIFSINNINCEQIISMIFTVTPDITAEYPAKVVRNMGYSNIPMLCVNEMSKDGMLPLCIRVLIHLDTQNNSVKHIYLHNAKHLRRDITNV